MLRIDLFSVLKWLSRMSRRATKLIIFTTTVLIAACSLYKADANAADVIPTKAPLAADDSTPRTCTNAWDFVSTNCQLTSHGITIYGTVDVGAGWQTHGAPFDPRSAVTASYLIQRQNRSPMWSLGANGLSNSTIGIKGTEPIGGNFSFVFAADTGFDPYSLRLSNGPGAAAANAGIPLNQQTAWSDSSRAGQWYNGQGYVGISSPTYGTLTIFRQNALTLDAVFDYDPLGASYAFSPIGFQGITCGGGNTENCRNTTSLKYRITVGQLRAAALWQFGGYDANNASNGAYQAQVGADIPTWGKGVLSFDAIYSYVRDSVSVALAPGSNNAAGIPIPPFLPQTLTATISDNRAVMVVAKYVSGPMKVYAGYEHIEYIAPSDPQTSFVDISGSFLCQGCASINNTNINNTAFGVDGFGNKTFQVMWAGAKYAVTEDLDLIAAYYHYIQNSYFGTTTGGLAPCSGSEHPQCAGTFDAISGVIDWRFAPKWDLYVGAMFSQVGGGLSNGYLQHNNIDPTVGLRLRF
jgi:predicted porin